VTDLFVKCHLKLHFDITLHYCAWALPWHHLLLDNFLVLFIRGLIYNTIKAFITRTWSAGEQNLRCRQSLGGGEDCEVGLREDTGKIICLKVPRKRGSQRAIADSEREFIPYRRCCITETSTASDCGKCRASVCPETGDCDLGYKERADEWDIVVDFRWQPCRLCSYFVLDTEINR